MLVIKERETPNSKPETRKDKKNPDNRRGII